MREALTEITLFNFNYYIVSYIVYASIVVSNKY